MIELYRTEESEAGAKIEEALRELVLAHRVFVVTPETLPETLPSGTALPALRDEGQLITGEGAIEAHLQQLEFIASEWRKYQADACYTNSENDHC